MVKSSLQNFCACGPTGYNCFRHQGFPLPSSRALRRSLEGLKFNSGILDEVFDMMTVKVGQMCKKESYCSVVLDEVSIRQSVEFAMRSGTVLGDATLPRHHGKARHAMVFMLAGSSTRWKQVVAYYFTGNSVYGSALMPIILNIIRKAHNIGLHVVAVTSDMGSCNRAMWKSFGVQCSRFLPTVNKVAHPTVPGQYLYFVADAPHVIKNPKAALINGQQITLPDWVVFKHALPSNVVTVDHLHTLASYQENLQLKLSPGLTTKILTPSHFDKMKVSNALNVFSHANSAALEYLV